MQFLRKAASITAIIFLPIFLFLFGFLFSLYQVFGSATSIKDAVEKSGAYDSVIQDSLSSIPSASDRGEENEGLPLDDPRVKKIVSQAVPSELLEEQATQFLDAVYGWVRGDTANLQFRVDLSSVKTNLVEDLSVYADERASTLPDCTNPAELNVFELESFDVFSIDCVPPGFDRAAAAEQVKNELDTIEFLEDPVITASDLANGNKTPEQQLQNLKNAYSALLGALYATGIGSLLLIAGAIFLAPKWRAGLRRVGIVAIVVGATSALIALAEAFFIKNIANGLAENRIQTTLADIVSALSADVRNWWLGYGVILMVLGIATLITLQVTKPKDTNPEPDKPKLKEKLTSPEPSNTPKSKS